MKSLVGLILGLVGSIFNLFLSGFFFVLFVLIHFGKSALIENNLSESLIAFATELGFWFIFLCIWFFIFGLVGVFCSSMMNRKRSVLKGGIGCLVSGFLTINLFLVIAGIMGIIVGRMDDSSETNQNVINVQPPIQQIPQSNPMQNLPEDNIPDRVYQ